MLRIRVPSARSDEELIEAAAAGDGQALSALYDRYAAAVYALAWGSYATPRRPRR